MKPKFNSFADIFYLSTEVDEYIDKLFKDSIEVIGENDNWFTLGSMTATRATHPRPLKNQAILINIEPIKPVQCQHHQFVIKKQMIETYVGFVEKAQCVTCGKIIKAKWEEDDQPAKTFEFKRDEKL
jgi:hypothetical protein